MSKTPDYVMRSLVACTELNLPQEAQHSTMLDALVIIRQLETENHQLLTKAQQLESTTRQVSKALCGKENATAEEIIAAFSQVKRERDAACLKNRSIETVRPWREGGQP